MEVLDRLRQKRKKQPPEQAETPSVNDEECKLIVRSYSWKLRQQAGQLDDADRALVEQEDADELAENQEDTVQAHADGLDVAWPRYLMTVNVEPAESLTAQEQLLSQSSQRLLQAWLAFKKALPNDKILASEPPNFAMLCSTLGGAIQSWKDKKSSTVRGKLQDRFYNVIHGFHGYRDLLAVIPNNDKYVCLLTGSLTAIAQATMTHANVAEGIASAFEGVQLDIHYWKRLLAANPNNTTMQNYVIELFVIVFEMFVAMFTQWTGKGSLARFFKSFNRDSLNEIVTQKLEKIDSLQQRLRDESGLSNTMAMQYVKNKIDSLDQTLEQRIEASIATAFGRLGSEYQALLREETRRLVASHLSSEHPKSSHLLSLHQETTELTATSNKTDRIPQAEEFRQHQAVVLAHFQEQAQSAGVNLALFERLQEWVQSMQMRHLHLEGPAHAAVPPPSTMSAAALVGVCERSEVPVLYFFCDDGTSETSFSNRQHKRNLLAQLLFCLLAQLLSYLPSETPVRLDKSASMSDVIEELDRLLQRGPDLLFCIVDGLQLLDDPEDMEQGKLLEQLALALTQEVELKDGRVMKTCFTTDGFVGILSCLTREGCLEIVEYGLLPGESNQSEETSFTNLE